MTATSTFYCAITSGLCGTINTSTTTITVNPVYAYTENHSICNGEIYNWHGTNYSTTGTFTANYTSINDCDSIYTLHLSVNPVDISVALSGITITANFTADAYQWLDCNNNFAPINGEVNQSFTATVNGNYAVIITQGLCSDTSVCVEINTVGIAPQTTEGITFYPNPVSNELIIEIKGNIKNRNFEILNAIGQVVFKGNLLLEKTVVQTTNFDPGVYLIKLGTGKIFKFEKILKE